MGVLGAQPPYRFFKPPFPNYVGDQGGNKRDFKKKFQTKGGVQAEKSEIFHMGVMGNKSKIFNGNGDFHKQGTFKAKFSLEI